MKRKLALILCVVAAIAMIFTLASCGEEKCEHTYSAEWSSDANGHWNAATCGCEGEISNYGIHADEKTLGEDGKLTNGKDGLCDTCSYKLCKEHTYATEWSTNETNHWNAATCGCDVKANDAKHVDANKDGNCDECKYVICDHSPVDAWSSDETYHWKETDCKDCDVDVALKGEHADENEDGRCDTCGYVTSFDYVLKSIINGLDSEAWFGVNSSIVNDGETFTKVYDNYTVVKDSWGNTKYYSYFGENDDILFVVYETEESTYRNIDAVEIEGVAEYEIVFYKVVASNHEDAIKGLYNLAMNGSVDYDGNPDGKSYGLVSTIDEEAGKYSFKFLFTINESAYEVSVEFEVDAEANGIKSATIAIDLYDLVDVTIDEENLTYTVNEGAEAISTKYEIAQTFGDPMSSEETPNPHPASKYVIDDLVLVDQDGNEVKDGDTVEIFAGYSNGLVLNLKEEQADLADFQLFTVTTDMETGWSNYPIRVYSDNAAEYEVEISTGLDTLSFTVKVAYVAPQTMSTFTINVDSGKGTSESEVTMYSGQSLMVNAVVSAGCDPTFTAEVTVGKDTAFFAKNEIGTYTFKPVANGDYEIKLTSSVASDVTATIKVTVIAPPTIEELLTGKYEGQTTNWINIEAEFGAENTVAITLDGKKTEWTEEFESVTIDLSGKATYTYEVNEETGALTLTKTEGDDIILESIYVENYEIVVQLENDFPCKLEKVVEEEPSDKEPTSNPFKVTVTDTYGWFDDFEFVADEAGKYTFDVPAGLGVASGNSYYVDFYANENGDEFSIELDAGESIVLTFGSLTKGDYWMSYIVSEAEPEAPVEGGLAGTYTAQDAYGNSFTVTITDTTITFQPPRSPMIEWTYTYVDGVLKLFKDGTEIMVMPNMQGLAVDTDKNVFSELYNNGTTYTLTKVASQGGNEQTYAGDYTATDSWNNSFDVTITETTITFTPPMSNEVVWTYEIDNGIVTLYVDGNAITMPMAGYAEVDTINYAFKSMMYNGTSYTLAKKTAGGNEEEEPEVEGGLAGTYTAQDAYGNSFAVTITDTTITFQPPRSPMVEWTYTYVDGVLKLFKDGTEIMVMANMQGLAVDTDKNVFSELYNNGTTYTLTKTGATGGNEGDDGDEGDTTTALVAGENNVISVTGDDMNMTVVTLTATADGTYTIYIGESGVVVYDYTPYLEFESITLELKAGDVVTLEVNNMYGSAGTVGLYVEFEEYVEKVEDPQGELKGLLSDYTYKIGDYKVGLTQNGETGVYYINVTDADGAIDLCFTYTLVDNGDGTFGFANLALYDSGYAAGEDQADAVKATIEAGTISANLTNNKAFGNYTMNGYSISLSRNTETGAYEANVFNENWTVDLYFTYEATDNGDGTYTVVLTPTGECALDASYLTWVVTPVAE